MEQGRRKYLGKNPREKANIFSIATFFYNYRILKKGKKCDLEEKDIYSVLPDFTAEKVGNKLELQWQKDRKIDPKTKLWKSLTKCFGLTYLFYTVVQLMFGTGLILYQPKVFSKFVAYFQPNQTALTEADAYLYASSVIGLNFLSILYTHNFAQLVVEYSIRIRTAVCSLIFRKALKISPMAFSEITIGKTVTLVTKDVFAIDVALAFLKDMVIGFLQLIVVTYILYQRVGYVAFPPMAVLLIVIPIQLILGKKTAKAKLSNAKKTDQRLNLLQETLSAIKIIKMYVWETFFERIISKARLKETRKTRTVYYLKILIGWLGGHTINIAFYILLISYVAQGHIVQAETVYFVQQCLYALKTAITMSIPIGIMCMADLVAALTRIQAYLEAEEVTYPKISESPTNSPKVYLNKVKVTLKSKDILKSVSLSQDNGLLLITGNVGSGKTLLLKTLLREYPVSSGQMEIQGSLSYAPEEPWLFPSTIRQNILFGQPYDRDRYQDVLNVCELTHDINHFDKLDQTIVGDKGINLSKGQQARITLARAVYRDSNIYLIDDCLSSLDNHVSDSIFKKCIKRFLKDKICIFVTNKMSNIKQVNTRNVLFLENGRTATLDEQNLGLDRRVTYYIDEEADKEERNSRKYFVEDNNNQLAVETVNDVNASNKLLEINSNCVENNLYHEEKKKGSVLWDNYKTYCKYLGNVSIMICLVLAFAVYQAAYSYADKLISLWVNLEPNITTYVTNNQTNTTAYEETVETRDHYLNMYTGTIVLAMSVSIIRSLSTFYIGLKAAQSLHDAMSSSMLHACMTFYDNHFIGNIINRLSKDFLAIDDYMPYMVFDILRLTCQFIGIIILVASVNLIFFIPAALLLIVLYFIQRFYIPTARSVRRLEAATRSPVIGYLNSTLEGLSVARASQQEEKLKMEFDSHQDLYTSTYYMHQTTKRFFSFSLDILGLLFLVSIFVKFLFFSDGVKAGDVGLAISQAMMLSAIIEYAIKQTAELESIMTSVERVLEYTAAKPERKSGVSFSNLPIKGNIKFSNVSLSYKSELHNVLKNINFEVEEGSKIGIVGRTGAGKSSIISALFRLYDFDGDIAIDNENIKSLSLDVLRSNIGIIPQDPVLFSGTIRTNIDPYYKYTDEDIWKTLEKVYMKHLVFDINQPVNNSSTVFSSGQKQLLCLARTIINKNKIIVLDEATANLDPETDSLLQKTIQTSFKDCTVIIIAHKIHSVMLCDKVLALEDGRIAEFDRPEVLLKNKSGLLYKMVSKDNFETFVGLTHM